MNKIEHAKSLLFSEKNAKERFENLLRDRFEDLLKKRKPDEFEEKIRVLGDYFANHAAAVGEKRAILDFQTGINLLNGYKKNSVLNEKTELREDSEFGEKTYAALVNVLKNYDIETVKRYLKLAAVNNALWLTKNNPNIDTDADVVQILQRL